MSGPNDAQPVVSDKRRPPRKMLDEPSYGTSSASARREPRAARAGEEDHEERAGQQRQQVLQVVAGHLQLRTNTADEHADRA